VSFVGESGFAHDGPRGVGVLLVNLGTPQAPTTGAVRRFLRAFLGDPRVVEVPRPLWWLILNGVILNLRPARSARLYRKVWTEEGSPLDIISRRQREALSASLTRDLPGLIGVALAMSYGRPSIADALAGLRQAGMRRLIVVPLYPQYSGTTTGAVFDGIARELMRWRWVPELRTVGSYHDEPGYIAALAASVRRHRAAHGAGNHLLMSFHGIPKRYFDAGDPYFCQCQKTARLLAEALELPEGTWSVSFQSRVGREPWLQPYTDERLKELARAGSGDIDLIAPAFAADCLETLEENAMGNRDLYRDAGGGDLRCVPCLNDDDEHISFLDALVRRHGCGWDEFDRPDFATTAAEQARDTRARARGMGAPQ
jgi:protoporphyrin/coproporphyrin ferrochelatase